MRPTPSFGSVATSSPAVRFCSNWELISQWNLFASPVSHVAYLQPPGHTALNNTIAFISENSPIALVSLFPPQLHFVLPGTQSPVESISTLGDEMLIVYAHGLSRVCDMKEFELRRSMDLKTATSVLAEGGWTTWCVTLRFFSFYPKDEGGVDIGAQVLAQRSAKTEATDAHCSRYTLARFPSSRTLLNRGIPSEPFLTVDLRADVEDALRLLPWAEARRAASAIKPLASSGDSVDLVSDTKNSRDQMSLVRLLLSHVATYGIDEDTDELLGDNLGVARPAMVLPVAVQRCNFFLTCLVGHKFLTEVFFE